MKPRYWLFAFLGALTLLRLLYISQLELLPDESYYYLWARHPALSYYSKGPGVAFAILASTSIFGATEFGVRFFSPLLALGTTLLMFWFSRALFKETVAIWAAIAMNMLPIFNAGGTLMTIDPLSIFFWTAAMCTCWLALERSPRFTLYWPLTGLLIGVGFLCKYTNAMEALSILLLLGMTPRRRREFSRPGLYIMLALFVVCTIPVFVWNSHYDWITFRHLRNRGSLNTGFSLHIGEPFVFLGLHMGVYSPLLFVGMMAALWWSFEKAAIQFKTRFLLFFSLPLLLMYGMLSLKKSGEPNWTAPSFISLGILATALWVEKARSGKRASAFCCSALTLGLAMSLVALNPDVLRKAGIALPYAKDPSAKARGGETAAFCVAEARARLEQATGKLPFLIASKYQIAASLSFYLPQKPVEGPGHPPVYIPESQDFENQFSFWPRYDEFVAPPPGFKSPDEYYTEEQGINPFVGRDALFVTDEPKDHVDSAIRSGFEKVELIGLYEIRRRGLFLRNVSVFACRHYKTLSL